ncbi:ArsR/SmtB family transcription factor [Zavarzinia compransoris]|uniref:Transcriptional regulator n=1 Tax=Zavarzinia compransoris TaxID=1264899 RepID=A0A317E9V4_9PROT|nr:metalloregulator ArsR/SmtB family transcription factor [Zavarzinia compransoris]PWR21915.1 transcriptional regulator [Zavarzinia compransoris]TDP47351.1 ArsR family transcriptional regulator [Zavarzinia compransoris]
MDESTAIEALGALAQPTRMAAFRFLVAALPEGVPAGDIAAALVVPHNTLSSHLAILARAGLVRSVRAGRTVSYRADLDGFQALVAFMTEDCCQGRPDRCRLPGGGNEGGCLA